MAVSFDQRVKVPSDALMQEMPDGESVFLKLQSERYFGLDVVGTRFYKALTGSESIGAAYELLLADYNVEPGSLRRDLEEWIEKLVEHGLIEVRGE
jgi:hypothetical protein